MHKMCLLNKYEKLIWKHMKSGMIRGNPEQIGIFLGAINLKTCLNKCCKTEIYH